MASLSIDVLFASLVLATILGLSIYAIIIYSGAYEVGAKHLICVSEAVRYSDFFLHTRDGVALTRSDVLVYGLVDCARLPSSYPLAESKGFSGRVCCGNICAGPDGDYGVTLRRTAYWRGKGIVPFTVYTCGS